jgi:uncharacterized protein (TIGR00730 family)
LTLNVERRVVTVFGSGRIPEESQEYADAFRLGLRLAERGYAVANGGYDGAMAAVSRGARQGGGHAIGMTVNVFGERPGNTWLAEEVRTETLFLRLEALCSWADAFIALPGGIGTLLEIALVWNLALVNRDFRKPLIVVGDAWADLVTFVEQRLIVGPGDSRGVYRAAGIDEALALLETLV